MKNAFIIAGGVAKGAFAAGALAALAANGIRCSRIVGASSGAINAAYWAAATRRGCEQQAAERIVDLWLKEGRWSRFLAPSMRAIVGGRGLSDAARLVALMRNGIAALPACEEQRDVELRLVLTSLRGLPAATCDGMATTFESVRAFRSSDFDTTDGIEAIVDAAGASAAFPGLFAPSCDESVDGGLVSNAPIKEAIDDGEVDRVFVIVPHPQIDRGADDYSGAALAGRLLDVLVQERLFRDLKEASTRNRALADLGDLVSAGRLLSQEQLDAVLEAIGWSALRRLDIIQIRPKQALPGGAFGGFADCALRQEYVDAGREAATAALAECDSPRRARA